jgi:hypothetical protein
MANRQTDVNVGKGSKESYSVAFNKGAIGKLQFPSDIGTDARPNFIVIYINEVSGTKYFSSISNRLAKTDQPASGGANTGASSLQTGGKVPETSTLATASGIYNKSLLEGLKTYAAGKAGDNKAFNRLLSIIALPMPAQFAAPLTTSWAGNDASAYTLAKAMSNPGFGDVASKIKESLVNKQMAEAKQGANSNRVVSNPAMESSFQSVSPRSYEMTWELYPKNLTEAKAIWDIIQILKAFALPSMAAGGSLLLSPAIFDFEFHHKTSRNDWLPKSLSCAIQNISVNYIMGGGFSGFDLSGGQSEYLNVLDNAKPLKDGSPSTGISLSVSFTEIEVLTRDRLDVGSSENASGREPFTFNIGGYSSNDGTL